MTTYIVTCDVIYDDWFLMMIDGGNEIDEQKMRTRSENHPSK
jgi:hypothetical protein